MPPMNAARFARLNAAETRRCTPDQNANAWTGPASADAGAGALTVAVAVPDPTPVSPLDDGNGDAPGPVGPDAYGISGLSSPACPVAFRITMTPIATIASGHHR